jgi:RNA polymerase sigma-70 factor (ECF subfamily)
MHQHDWLADRFEERRARLGAVAFRMLGSASEAEDAVQESWLRLSRSNPSEIENLDAWLTTVVARVCLNMLRARKSRREEPLSLSAPEPAAVHRTTTDPEHEALLADSVGLALLVVLETLPPAERVAFVLHDMFAVPFDEIAPIVGRSSVATRQLASRARRRVQGAGPTSDSDLARRRQVVDAFLAASRRGDFQALLAVLDPEVVLRADDAVVQMGGPRDVRGERAVAETFSGRAQAARLALVDGAPGAVWTVDGRPRVVFLFTVANGKIVAIDMLADPEVTERLELISLED